MCVHHYRFIEGVQVLCHFSSSAYAIKLNKEKNHCVAEIKKSQSIVKLPPVDTALYVVSVRVSGH